MKSFCQALPKASSRNDQQNNADRSEAKTTGGVGARGFGLSESAGVS